MNYQKTKFIFNQGKLFWERRDYNKALEYFLQVLEHSHRKDWLYQIAVLTGGAYKMEKITTGKYPLLLPDGKQIIFVSKENNSCNIFITNCYGKNKRKLIRITSPDYVKPKLSPDGRYLVFINYNKGKYKIYILNLKTKEIRCLSRFKGNIHNFAFSPDSKYIAFSCWRSDNAKIQLLNLEKLVEIEVKTKEMFNYESIFSPDGSKVIFLSSKMIFKSKVFVVIEDLNDNSRIVQEVPKKIFLPLCCSPDSKYVVFGYVNGFYLLSLDIAVRKRIAFYKCKGKVRNFNFSKDGRYAIFISENNKKYKVNILDFNTMRIRSIFDSNTPLRWCYFLIDAKKIICAKQHGEFIDKLFLINFYRDIIYPIDTDVPCGFRNIKGQSNVSFHCNGKKIIFAHSEDGDYHKYDQICQMKIEPLQVIKRRNLIDRVKKLLAQEKVMLKRAELIFRLTHPLIKEMIKQVSLKNLKKYIETLQNFGPRPSGSDSCKKAADFLYNLFTRWGLDVQYDNYKHPQKKKFNSQNVIATILGRANPKSIYLICAHYDSCRGSPGAWDDASGIAVVLETARILRSFQPRATIKFICFSGEELGNIGSTHFVHRAKSQGLNIHGVIDNDCIGYHSGNKMAATLFYSSTPLLQVLKSVSMLYLDLLTYSSTNPERCSVLPFMREFGNITVSIQDYPYLPSPYLHHSKDRINLLFFPLIAEITKLNLAALTTISVCPAPVEGIKIERQKNNRRLCISWKENKEKDIKGYYLYCGIYPNIFDKVLDIGKINFYTLDNLPINKPFFINIRAYNNNGYESWGAEELNIHNYPL